MHSEELWSIYSPKLKSYIMRHVSDRYEVEDILQEVGLRIKENESKIKDINNVEAWLYRIAHNLIADYFRVKNKFSLVEDIGEIAAPAKPEPENYNMETAECLLKLVEYLPSTYREAIIESDYNGKKQSTLGKQWGLSNSGSKTRIQRARKKLKAVLYRCCEVESDNAGNIIKFNNRDNVGAEFSCLKC